MPRDTDSAQRETEHSHQYSLRHLEKHESNHLIWETRRARRLSSTDFTSTPKESQAATPDIEASNTNEAEANGVIRLK